MVKMEMFQFKYVCIPAMLPMFVSYHIETHRYLLCFKCGMLFGNKIYQQKSKKKKTIHIVSTIRVLQ